MFPTVLAVFNVMAGFLILWVLITIRKAILQQTEAIHELRKELLWTSRVKQENQGKARSEGVAS